MGQCVPLYHIGSLMSPICTCPPVYAAPCLRGQCKLLHQLWYMWTIYGWTADIPPTIMQHIYHSQTCLLKDALSPWPLPYMHIHRWGLGVTCAFRKSISRATLSEPAHFLMQLAMDKMPQIPIYPLPPAPGCVWAMGGKPRRMRLKGEARRILIQACSFTPCVGHYIT